MSKLIESEVVRLEDTGVRYDVLTERDSKLYHKSSVEDLENYIILPAFNLEGYSYPELLVSTERTFSRSWIQAHHELSQQNAFMINIRQYFHFLTLLESENVYDGNRNKMSSEMVNSVLNWILRDEGGKVEWLDAKFEDLNGRPIIKSNHRIVEGKLIPQKIEFLDDCVMDNFYVTFGNQVKSSYVNPIFNAQGLPVVKSELDKYVKGKNIYYRPPAINCVATFFAGHSPDVDFAVLECNSQMDNFNLNEHFGFRKVLLMDKNN